MNYNKNAIWITWENQRRSVELAKHIGAKYFELSSSASSGHRVMCLILKTIKLLLHEKPTMVFVQNPSNILAAFICFCKNFSTLKVVVDRHSNFIFDQLDAVNYSKVGVLIGNFLSSYSLARADLTIVTNEYIKNIVIKSGGRPFVLPDKIPDLSDGERVKHSGKYNILFPCTFSPDEPVEEVIKAAKMLPEDIMIYITGNDKKYNRKSLSSVPVNIVFTGFISEEKYQSYIKSCTIVLALTTREHTLLCCAYESVSVGIPMVLSDKEDLYNYFYKGIILTDNSSVSIAHSIKKALSELPKLSKQIMELRKELMTTWDKRFGLLLEEIALINGEQ